MNKRLIAVIAAALTASVSLTGCNTQTTPAKPAPKVVSKPLTFEQASEAFMNDFWQSFPDWALWSGNHKYDHILTLPNQKTRDKTLAFVKKHREQFNKYPIDKLNVNQQIDLKIIQNRLNRIEWNIKELKSFEWQPSSYNIASEFAQIFNTKFDTLENRLRIATKRLEKVPEYYQLAYSNLTNPTLEHTKLAIQQNKGGLGVFGDKLMQQVDASSLTDSEKQQFKQRVSTAKDAINQYVNKLEQLHTELEQNGTARSFRLGQKLYQQKFDMQIQSQYSAKTLYEKALADKKRVQVQMTKLTDELWPKYFPNKIKPRNTTKATNNLIKHIAQKHVKRENFVEEIRKQIPELEAFIVEKDLISVDPKKPLVVRETPKYMRGIAGASISAPGPFEKNENTYYNVTPLDHMTDQQAASYLREYNHWMLQILNIHEAIPGHYTQLVYANESPSLVKSVFGNTAMIEGWAVYTEIMMLEQGYGNFEPEMWLMYYKWNLRVIANTILDYAVHNLNMSKSEALNLLMNDAFQEQAEAEGKWRRVTLSQVQLTSYYSGYREIYDFREEQKQKLGDKFDLKTFHEQFLSYGSAPVKYIKQMMR